MASLDGYAGKWVAQVGDEVIASGDTLDEVTTVLQGRDATIWRVPATSEEADSMLAFAVDSAEVERILARFEAAVRFLYPEEMTPNAKRVLESIIQTERER